MPNEQAYRLGGTLTAISFAMLLFVDITSEWYVTVGFFAVAITAFCLVWKGSAK